VGNSVSIFSMGKGGDQIGTPGTGGEKEKEVHLDEI
jgi:hypothetical protein